MPRSQQAGMFSQDPRFQDWMQTLGTEETAEQIRLICQVLSRADLTTDPDASKLWDELLHRFLTETGREAEIRDCDND